VDKVTSDLHGLRVEYLKDVLKPLEHFSVDLPRAGLDVEGRPMESVEKKHFQILSITHSQSRPQLMPTIESHGDVSLKSALALNIQEYSAMPGADVAEGSVLVYPDRNPLWVDWKDLGDFTTVRETLRVYRSAMGSESNRGCIMLSDSVHAVPVHAVTDMKCPALVMLSVLYREGWRPARSRIVHVSPEPGQMDAREATRMKSYYLVLMKLPQCLPLTTSIPSDQPIMFYQLLLRGVRADPNLGHKAYVAISNGQPIPTPPPLGDDELEFARPAHRLTGPGSDMDPRGSERPDHPLPIAAGPPGSSRDPPPRGKASSHGPRPKAAQPHVAPKAGSSSASVDPVSGGPEPPLPPEIEFAPVGPALVGPPLAPGRRCPGKKKKMINAINGGRCNFQEYLQPNGNVYANWFMECPRCPKSDNCGRTLGVRAETTKLGYLEPLAFLHVWKELTPGPNGHRKTHPIDTDVASFYTRHARELEVIWGEFATP
jgi:hypothetical protein